MTTASDAVATLAARSLSKHFGARLALREVSFEVGAGELVAVIGPNGAGKTTLLSILAGVLDPSSGEVSRPRGRVGWVPQRTALYSKLSVAENLRLFARLEGVAEPEEAVRQMLAQTGLETRPDEQVSRLSGGNQQRVNIAIGLLNDPAVLLLDEPSAALDPRQRARLWEFIGDLASHGTTVLYSTHDVAEAERYARRVLVLVDGELLFTGTPADLDQAVADGSPPGEPSSDREAVANFEAAFVRFLHAHGH